MISDLVVAGPSGPSWYSPTHRRDRDHGTDSIYDNGWRVIDGGDDWVDIKLNESNTSHVGYEWRLQNGPGRPVKKSNHGVLRITEPRLLIDTDQQLGLGLSTCRLSDVLWTTVDLGCTKLIEETDLRVAERTDLWTGCSSMASHAVPHWVLALLLGLAYRRRRTYRSFSLIYLFFFVSMDAMTAHQPICPANQSDCPAGRICVDNFCVLNRKCESDSECCGHQTCRDGQCEALATDGCTSPLSPAQQRDASQIPVLRRYVMPTRPVNLEQRALKGHAYPAFCVMGNANLIRCVGCIEIPVDQSQQPALKHVKRAMS